MTLRPYQLEAVTRIREAIVEFGSVVYVCPTGSGKTIVAGEISRLAAAKGSRTLLLVHRRELVRQSIDTLGEACPDIGIGVEAAGWPSAPWYRLQVGMVQSIARREYVAEPDVVIIDESHHSRASTWATVLARWPNAARIGLTATPERLDGKGLSEHFATMIVGPSITELVADGHLAPTRTLTIPVGLSVADVKKDKHGEYQQGDLAERVTARVIANAADAYERYAAGKQAIFFGIDIAHSQRVCAELRSRGIRAEHVDGQDPQPRRDRIMREFKQGVIQVVTNCDLISEGYDAPACEVVMDGAPTMSITRYLQRAGRMMRPGEGKVGMLLDLAGNAHNLGLPDQARAWSLEDGEVNTRTAVTVPKTCERCQTSFYGQRCTYCQYERATEEADVDEVSTELHDAATIVQPPPNPRGRRAELMGLLRQARHAPDRREALRKIADDRGYKAGWVSHIMRAWAASERT